MRMKFTPLFLFFFLAAITRSFSQAPTDLFISEYVEGSSNNKALEFYNGTGGTIDLTAGNYVIQMYFNGSTTASTTISLTGTVAPNGVFVLAQASASFASSSFVNQTSSASFYNGDDAIVLRKGGASGTIVDAIGQVGVDPGTEWGSGLVSTADNTLRRKASVCAGDTNPSDVFDPAAQWDGFATDDFSGLGVHTSACATAGPSIIVNGSPLSFTTTVGTPAAEQSYTIHGSSLTEDVTVTIPSLSNFGLSLTPGGPYTNALTIPVAQVNAGNVAIYVTFNPTAAGTQSGNITHVSGTASTSLAVQGATTGTGAITRIFDIQGTGDASPLTGAVVTTEGIVTADFQGTGQLGGFFIQDSSGDGNILTSDGIFISNTSFPVKVGDHVRLTGTVAEAFNKTEISSVTSLTVLSSNYPLMPPVDISLPVNAVADLERYEGMLVRFPQTLTVSETFTTGRYGEVLLSANGRLITPTNIVDPNDNPASGTSSTGTSNLAAVNALTDLNLRSQILLDDGSNVQNPPVVPYLDSAGNTIRIGSTLTALTGALDFDFSVYRLQPSIAPVFHYARRPAVPSVGTGSIKIGSFNVLNYFNGDGQGGGFPTSRGATTLAEFNRQRAKIIAAIVALDADVLGLTEIENDGDGPTSAIADLVSGLNAATAPGTYAIVPSPTGGANGTTGTDEIKVAMIYKPGKVTPVGLSFADVNPIHNRPPLAQTFNAIGTGEKFSLVINHFKSKGCSGASGANTDQLDGQSCFNATRKQQAIALLSFLDTVKSRSGDPDIVSVGDYNAYEEEDPIDILRAGGLVDLTFGLFSYVFDGQSGALDYAFATPSLAPQVTGAGKWNINAEEPVAKDYNQEFNQPYLYAPDAFRSSDHDPVLVGLQLGPIHPTVTITSPADTSVFAAGSPITLSADASATNGVITRVEFYDHGVKFLTDSTAPYSIVNSDAAPGSYVLTAKAFDSNGDSAISGAVHVTITGCKPTGLLTGEGYTNIPGTQVADLTGNPAYPYHPSITAQLSTFEYANVGDNYGGRVSGFICAPLTGNYTFYIASDDQAGLYLSTDDDTAHKVLIAYNAAPTGFRNWTSTPTQKSAPIRLVQGARYYIETLHKQGAGANYLSVGWVMPNGVGEGPIPSTRISPYSHPSPGQTAQNFVVAMEKANVIDNKASTGKLEVTATPNPSSDHFTLVTRSSSDKALTIVVTDVAGRVVERRLNVAANGTVLLGSSLPIGMYFVTVRQEDVVRNLKLIKR
ncbi:ExeM/NucH family extracellular endonuclease [Flavitalea sp. BT771]|uniref:ExeM/NucH family extracellular endonuclease n=1 Tax=Flavitalea sp. BT771 TaxID=3063329 RepID=UPI0026E2F8DD|nr:ExeM/NucH family extracellular endonuclease [Flavitalea sp. BT771]MDO6433213.1 ExeM/NucH family extracellular endonuclease [Flavitalea sp. BT771]MDV6221511.1 ExeM/NucH family extracellular endonuclease [Flavitalea sp. BT771]